MRSEAVYLLYTTATTPSSIGRVSVVREKVSYVCTYRVMYFEVGFSLLESPLHPGGKDKGRVQDQDLNQCLNKTFAGYVEGNLLPTVGIADSGDV